MPSLASRRCMQWENLTNTPRERERGLNFRANPDNTHVNAGFWDDSNHVHFFGARGVGLCRCEEAEGSRGQACGLLVILLVSHCHLARAAGWTGQSHRVMANPDQVLQLYQEALAIGRAWAESGISADLGLLSQNLPDVMLEDLHAEILGVATAMVLNVSEGRKLALFREEIDRFMRENDAYGLMASRSGEPWFAKDIVQLVCELLLFEDPSSIQRELAAVVMELVIVFGYDAMTLLGFVLVLRCKYMLGRGSTRPDESGHLLDFVTTAIRQANAYLISEHAGSADLSQLVQSLSLPY
ncbi:uncharacterized protein MONBRDRAFT_31309 [Monosiga brevicollis MX1]|uniref:Uncharacterized protein n=1 Tax=Monosiga brevicollis TaxID=81824 RepID=A9UR67_MONBE|nr:uncharacterized protein MONBRDRAFT_31309 [Monosiga brevicollis MX1]EDQ91868.1 predicted protein [Monosiga brevicollis MX1]|eukprot:XP_001743154.1 hypothetical protein [Monosiga brevicollis MX1]